MRFTKKLAALLLALTVLVAALPLGAMLASAADIDRDELEWGGESGITRAQWLHDLVVVFELELDEASTPDNYFSDLSDTHTYYTDILTAVDHGLVDVGAGYAILPDAPVTRDFAAHTLNFCLGYQLGEDESCEFTDAAQSVDPVSAQIAVNRGWFALSEGKFCPQATVTAAEVERMLTDAAAALEKEIIDPNHEDVISFREDVTVLPEDTQLTKGDDGTVTVTDCPVTIESGDKFACFFGGIPQGFLAVSVTESQGQTVITTQELSLEETFVELDIQGVTDATAMHFTPAAGAQAQLIESGTSGFGVEVMKTLSVSEEIDLGDGISMSVTADLTNPRVEYSIGLDRAYAKLITDTEVTYSVSADLSGLDGDDQEVTLGTLGVPGVGGLSLSVTFELKGSIECKVQGLLTVGVECTYGENLRAIKSYVQRGSYLHAEVSASVGLKVSFGITELPVLEAYIYAEAGFAANMELSVYDQGTPKTCGQFAAYLYLKGGATAGVEFFGWKKSVDLSLDLFDASNSPLRLVYHYEDGREVAACTRDADSGTTAPGRFGSTATTRKYYTNASSPWTGNGWTGASKAHSVNAAGESVQVYEYDFADAGIYITRYCGNAWSVNIPKQIDGYTVVGIGRRAFAEKRLSHITIPDTVEFIDEEAFDSCTNLESVTLPKNLSTLGYSAFRYCTGLHTLFVPKALTHCEDYMGSSDRGAFYGCVSLKNVTLEQGLPAIPDYLFIGCDGIETVTIPSSVTSIGYRSFAYCGSLTEVVIPDGVRTIDDQAYYYACMTSVEMADSVTSIGNSAFESCMDLETVTLSKGLQSLGYSAFRDCTELTAITIPKTLTHCEDYAGYINHGAFTGCISLKNITLEQGLPAIPDYLFIGCDSLETITIPSSVTVIGFRAFSHCSGLTKITIPQGVRTISSEAFYNTGITSLEMADTVTLVDNSAFESCTKLETVTLSKNLQSMGYCVFRNCTALTAITIPKTLTHCEDYAGYINHGIFYGCSALKSITLEEGINTVPAYLFIGCNSMESITIPSSVTVIGFRAFSNCSGLTQITVPEGVREIHDEAFANSGIKQLTLADSVASIGDSAFESCTKLESVTMSKGLQSMGYCVFRNCTALTAITIPKTLTHCEDYASYVNHGIFYGCSALKNITLEEGTTAIPSYLFIGCASMESITIPSSVTSIGSYAFAGCVALKNVTLPDSLVTLGANTFENCDSLTHMDIPAGVTSLGGSCFYDCDGLKSVTMADTVATMGSAVFQHCDTLKSVTLSRKLKSIPNYTFMECLALERVTVPYHVTSIGSYAFNTATSLKQLVLPRGLTSIDSTALSYPNLTQIYGVPGTYAQTWADSNGFAFVSHIVNATEATLDKTEMTLFIGNSDQILLFVTPLDANDEIAFKSINTAVATVTGEGVVKGISPGTTTIRVSAGDISADCKVTVLQPVTKVKLDKTSLSLQALETAQLTPTVTPDDAHDTTLTWTSSDETVVTVTQDGVITAQKKGHATVTATANDGSGKSASCAVTVTNNGYAVTAATEMESPHNYTNSCTDFWIYTSAGKHILDVTFDARTYMEADCDYLCIYDGEGSLVGKYTGSELSGKTVSVPGETVKLQLSTDSSSTAWGFKVTAITARQLAGWVRENGKWAFYENGKKVTNTWKKDSTGWCYLTANGYMATNQWVRDSVGWCYVGASGYMVYSKWVSDAKGWCYVGADGYMVYSKWVADSTGWCYVGADGYMATNKWVADSTGWCYVGANGYIVYNKWVADSTGWCYVGANGYMVYNKWVADSKGWCYVGANGYMVTNQWVRDSVGWCYIGADGYAVTNCWKRDSVGWCYLNGSGSMVKNNWVYDNGWYWLDANGYMVCNTSVKISGKTYYFNAKGLCTNP